MAGNSPTSPRPTPIDIARTALGDSGRGARGLKSGGILYDHQAFVDSTNACHEALN